MSNDEYLFTDNWNDLLTETKGWEIVSK